MTDPTNERPNMATPAKPLDSLTASEAKHILHTSNISTIGINCKEELLEKVTNLTLLKEENPLT